MYLTNLQAMGRIDRERLLKGNWKIRPAAGLFFKRAEVTIIEHLPTDIVQWVRAWDLAATDADEGGDPAYTAGVLMGKRAQWELCHCRCHKRTDAFGAGAEAYQEYGHHGQEEI